MSTNKQHIAEELAAIIQLLADAWPTDKENIPLAGAKFEEVIDSLGENFPQMKKLADLSWKGLIHLYQKDEYFMMVKAGTMSAINVCREYIISDGDVKVEDFEKAYDDLDKALKGGAESADTIIQLDDHEIQAYQNKRKHTEQEPTPKEDSFTVPSNATLDDLASYIMILDEASATSNQIQQLVVLLERTMANATEPVREPLKQALEVAKRAFAQGGGQGWLEELSTHVETATNIESEEEWEASQQSEAEAASPPDEPEEAASEAPRKSKTFIIPEDIEISMVGEFITECTELIEMAESALLDLEDSPNDEELINTVFRAFHTIKGTSAFMGLEPITEFTHHVETVLSIVRDGELPFDRACADINFESIDIIKQMLAGVEVSKGGDPLSIPDKFDTMLLVLTDVSEKNIAPAQALQRIRKNSPSPKAETTSSHHVNLKEAPEANTNLQPQKPTNQKVQPPPSDTLRGKQALENKPDESASALGNEPQMVGTQKNDADASVRVSVSRLDRLIDMVGELVIAHSVVAQDQNIPKDSELQKKVNHATKIIRELQDTSLTLRMVPLRATFHKMNRLVRDLSRKAGKSIKFITSGEDTEIDRNMVDIINEPLIHMLRNSVDHGIETPEERAATDKAEVASIALRAFQEGGKVVIQIQDDGRGIDKDKILAKAKEKGLVEPDKKLSEAEIYALIFEPGFSTKEKVTDLSGRGVGMDVVRRSIEELQGKVEVASQLGKGTTITIELPFTLAITDGMLIRVGAERFIIPTISIDMTFRAENEDLFTVLGESEQVLFRGNSIPVIRLHRLFEIEDATEDIREGTLLIIKNNKSRYALLVDEVLGQQQLVGKSINMIATTSYVSGGAILGDGKVGLILDTTALMV